MFWRTPNELQNPDKVKRMKENQRDIKVTSGMLKAWDAEMERLKKENEQLRQNNKALGGELTYFKELSAEYEDEINFKTRQNNALKLRCSSYSLRIGKLETEIADMKFTQKMLNSEEAGRAFARELLGKPMTEEELAIEAAENAYIPYVGDDF